DSASAGLIRPASSVLTRVSNISRVTDTREGDVFASRALGSSAVGDSRSAMRSVPPYWGLVAARTCVPAVRIRLRAASNCKPKCFIVSCNLIVNNADRVPSAALGPQGGHSALEIQWLADRNGAL